MDTPTSIVLLGNTGSGKTTVAKELTARHSSLVRISSGDIAREMAESDSATRASLKAGGLAPEEAMRSAVRTRIQEAEKAGKGWVLDGFPRTVEQLILLMQWSDNLPQFIWLQMPVWNHIERLTDRDRHDDNPDAIAARLRSFNEQTGPMIDILTAAGVVTNIHASLPTEIIVDKIDEQV